MSADPKPFVAMVHVGLRERPFVLDDRGRRYDLPLGYSAKEGKVITVRRVEDGRAEEVNAQ